MARAASGRLRSEADELDELEFHQGAARVRFRDEKPGDMDRAREAVREWRAQHPDGAPDQLVADIGDEFHHGEWAPVLRSILQVADRHAARVVSRTITGTTGASR